MEERPDRQRPTGPVAPVLRDPSGYTQALAFIPLLCLPSPSLALFLSPPPVEQVEGRRGGGGGYVAGFMRSVDIFGAPAQAMTCIRLCF